MLFVICVVIWPLLRGVPNTSNLAASHLCLPAEVPIRRPIAGVRIGWTPQGFIVNPTAEEMQESKLDLVLAGTSGRFVQSAGSGFEPNQFLDFHLSKPQMRFL